MSLIEEEGEKRRRGGKEGETIVLSVCYCTDCPSKKEREKRKEKKREKKRKGKGGGTV